MNHIKLLLTLALVCPAAISASNPLSTEQLESIRSSVESLYEQPETFRSLVEKLSKEEIIFAAKTLEDPIASRFLNNLGEKSKNLPATLAEDIGAVPQGSIQALLSMLLPMLAYEGSEAGILEYQADLGNEQTGTITLDELMTLQRRVARAKDSPVVSLSSWPSSNEGSVDILVMDDHVSVEGTWAGRTHELAYPINTAEIKCWRNDELCIISESNIDVPSLDEERERYFLETSVRRMKLVSWTENEITAVSESLCRSNTLTISLSSREVFETVKNNWSDYCEESSFTVKLPTPQVDELVPGLPVTSEFWDERKEIITDYYNSRLKARLEEAISPLQ